MRPPSETNAIVNASRELLKRGDAEGALKVLNPVFPRLKADAEVLHLMGSIKQAEGKLDEAERHYRSAIAFSLREGAYYHDLGVVLQARGAFDEAIRVFRAALVMLPQAASVRVNLVRCLLSSGDAFEAEKEALVFVGLEPGAEAWTLLHQVQRAQGRDEEALVSAANALKYDPTNRGVRLNYAGALDRVGRGGEALEYYERLVHQSLDSSELAVNFVRALYAAGRQSDADAIAQEALKSFPGAVSLHATLARIRALAGAGEVCVAHIEAAIAQRPRDLHLRLACADSLHRAGLLPKAARVLEEALALAPDAPALLTAYGIVLDELDRPGEGLKALRRVCQIAPDARAGRRNLLSTLLRAGFAEEALKETRALRVDEPEEQYLIACEATALRVLRDESYRHWYDYDRLVRCYEIPAPQGFFTLQNFNADFAEALRAQHRANAHPLDQYVTNGSQTGRNMLTHDERTVRAFLSAVDAAVRDYIGRLRVSPNDAVGQRKRDAYRYAKLWSLRLTDGGYQGNHVHDRGWISSAYYVNVAASEKGDARNGWLKLGEPNRAIQGCAPEKFIEPKPGLLVLFPSYMWHGTAPFSGSERLSAAFEIAPA
jgi:tetratricopeptide (TPR) repeat protein